MTTNLHISQRLALALVLFLAACGTGLAAANARTVWLDELDVGNATSGWGPAKRNRSVEGKPLTIAGETYARGLGTHAPGLLRISLGGAAARFTARVGVDDEVAKRPSKASLEFKVLGDGVVLWASGIVERLQPARQVDVDLKGIKLLELVVTDGGDGYACDHADWAEAKFEVAANAKIATLASAKRKEKAKTGHQGKHQPNPTITGQLDLTKPAAAGAKILTDFSGKPDDSRWGVLGTYELLLPRFANGLFFSHANPDGRGWPNMMNRAYPWAFKNEKESIARLNDGGIFFILPIEGGGYLAVTAVGGARTQSWFHTDESGRILLSFGTFGTAEVRCDAPLLAWARSDDVYEACHEALRGATGSKPLRGRAHFRHEKAYPEYFAYLGWCSWEHFKGRIDEAKLLGVVDGIEASGLPIRYVIVDDGHTSTKRGAMDTFNPKADRFPHGWAPLLARRKADRVRWMGLWHDFKGYHAGIAPENDFGEALNRHFEKLSEASLTVRNNPESALAFYRAFMGSVKAHGFDFVKTDFQSAQLARLAGKVDNAVERCAGNSQAFETALEELGLGLINCNWHNPANFHNCRASCVGRCSIDYSKGSLGSAKRHLLQSYANILWLGQLAWGDHDMFHSSHQGVGRIMAVSKAMAGGPVYLSDPPEAFVAEVITPLCYGDGRLLRPLAPAAPLPDSVVVDPVREAVPYRVIAPLPGRNAAVVAYNLFAGAGDTTLKSSVTPDDYTHAGGMVQPPEGRWRLPAEGLVVYDWHARKGEKLGPAYAFDLKGFTDRLVHLCPIRSGWAVIGRTDKYLSPAAVEAVRPAPSQLTFRLAESGPFAVWVAEGTPSADGLEFRDAGGGLWHADMPVGKRNVLVTVTRK